MEGYGRNFRSKSLRATPTASSEASWNSRTGLLSNPPGLTGVSLKNLAWWSAAKKWFSRRNCCCTGENSVVVKEVTLDSEHREPIVLIDTMKSRNRNSNKLHTDGDQRCSITDNVVEIHHIKAMAPKTSTASSSSSMDAPRQQRISATGRPFIDAFTFPILNSSSDQATCRPSLKAIVAKSTVNPLENTVMENFQPVPSLSRPSSMENHVNARGPFRPGTGSPIAREDDVGSDASSDLFEIECFSTQTTSCPMQMHCWWDSVDENSNNARSLVLENGINNLQHCRRSVDELAAADGCNRETEQTKGQRKGNGLMLMSSTQEKAAAVKCVAEGPPLIPLHVTVSRGSSPSSPLSVASMA